MANLLGVPSYDSSLDRENMQIQAAAMQNLGAQVRQDLTSVLTNRQLQNLAADLQYVDPNSKQFPQQAMGLMMQYPLAAKSPIGTAAIQQLGAQHKLWAADQLKDKNWRVGAGGVMYNQETGDYKTIPGVGSAGKLLKVQTPNGAMMVNPTTGEPVQTFGDPFPEELPAKAGTVKMGTDGTMYDSRNGAVIRDDTKKPNVQATQQEKAIGQALNQAIEDLSKTDSEIGRLQSLWEQIPEDDGNMFDPKTTNRNLKYTTGIKANALRQKAAALNETIKSLGNQLKSIRPDPVIPGLTPTDVAPVAPANQDITAPAGELMVPVPETSAPKVIGTYRRNEGYRENVQAR